MGVFYCTREDVKSAVDIKESARSNAQVDRLIDAASRSIEGLTHRKFYPQLATKFFSPSQNDFARPYRLWLGENEIISLTSLVASGIQISPANYYLEPANSGPPFTSLELNLNSSLIFSNRPQQRTISLTGLFGYSNEEATGGSLVEDLDAVETEIDGSNSFAVGVGSIIRVDQERMLVVGKNSLSTGQVLQTDLSAQVNAQTVQVQDGNTFVLDEVIILDAERMYVTAIAGNNLTVKRAWDGTVLANHSGSTIFVPRSFQVFRGALGTTPAVHNNGSAIFRHEIPALVRQLAVAETVAAMQQEGSAYARVVGSGENLRESVGRGLKDLRELVKTRYGRKVRTRAI